MEALWRWTCLLMMLAMRRTTSTGTCKVGPRDEPSRFERVPENLEPGTHVLVFEVEEASQLKLHPVSKEEDYTAYFSPVLITNQTGGVVLARHLTSLVQRPEPVSVVRFRVTCESQMPFMGSDSLLVTLYIEDVNDHSPEFEGDPYNITVDELTPKGMIIFDKVIAKDQDKPNTANSDIYYWISSGNENLKFSLSPLPRGGAAVVLEKLLDFENGDREINLTITASDRGAPARLSRALLRVTVQDGDDQPPVFTAGVYRASVTEYPGPQMRSLELRLRTAPPIVAYDGDLAVNQSLRFRIRSGNAGGHFRIDNATGALTLIKTFDRERLDNDVIPLVIEAAQTDDRTRTAQATVLVTVTDLNDNKPDFLVDRYNISIIENLLKGFSIVQVRATDKDKGDNAEFTYSLDDPSGAFDLDPRTGWLTVADQLKLDRETRPELKLEINAEELTKNVLRSQSKSFTRVIINLLDSNDNNPQFLPTNTYQFVVEGNSSVDRVIGRVKATDPDDGENGQITFSFENTTTTSSGEGPAFSVSPLDGAIRQQRPLPAGSYVLFVRAEDAPKNKGEVRSALAVVTVLVRIKNVRPPRIPAGQRLWVGSDIRVPARIGQLIVDDPDGDELTFRLRNVSVPFDIENDTGYIRVSAPLAAANQSKYSLAVDVTDGTHLATSMIDIIIVAENAKEAFESASLTFEVEENVANITLGYLLENSTGVTDIKAKILNPSLNQTFRVTSDAGLKLLVPLDFEERRQLSFTAVLEFQDGGARRHVARRHVRAVALTVRVLDSNDNPPRFSSLRYRGAVSTSAEQGELVSVTPAVRVSDADSVRSQLSFHLGDRLPEQGQDGGGDGCGAAFEISQLALVSVADPAKIQQELYECEIEVKDEDGLRSRTTLSIVVKDWESRDQTNENAVADVALRESSTTIESRTLEDVNGTTIRSVGDNDNDSDDEMSSTSASLKAVVAVEEIAEAREIQSRALSSSSMNLAQLLTNIDESNSSAILRETVTIPSNLPRGSVIYRLPETVRLKPLPSYEKMRNQDFDNDAAEVWRNGTPHGRHFMIDFEEHVVRIANPLNEEGQIVVRVQSQEDHDRLEDLLLLVVDVVLVHRPEIIQKEQEFELDEGEYMDKLVGKFQLKAWPENDDFVFSISDGSTSYRVSQDGEVYISGTVDYEKSHTIRIPVQVCPHLCTDLASRLPLEGSVQDACLPSCDQANVTLKLRDINDNSPVYTGVSDVVNTPRGVQNEPAAPYAVYKLRVPTSLSAGEEIANISAYDADSDTSPGGAVRYKIITPGDDFVIGAESGRVTAVRNMSYPSGSVRRLTLVTYDLGSPSRSAFAVLELTASDGGKAGMIRTFDKRVYVVNAQENQNLTRVRMPWGLEPSNLTRSWSVLILNSTNYKSALSASIVNDSILEINGPLDYEISPLAWLLVTLHNDDQTSSISPQESSLSPSPSGEPIGLTKATLRYNQAIIKVRVVDSNDNVPEFSSPYQSEPGSPVVVGVPHDAGYGYNIIKLQADDADVSDTLRYRLNSSASNVRTLYGVDPDNGQVWLLKRADGLPQRIHRLQVVAMDTANHTATLPLLVYVLDARDMMVAQLNQSSDGVQRNRIKIERGLSVLADADVRIVRVAPHSAEGDVEEGSSDVWLYALESGTRTLLGGEDLMHRLGRASAGANGDGDLGDLDVRVAGMRPAREQPRGFYTNLKFIIVGLSLTIFLLMSLTLAVLCCKSCKREQKTSPYPPLALTPAASGYSTTPPPTSDTDVIGSTTPVTYHTVTSHMTPRNQQQAGFVTGQTQPRPEMVERPRQQPAQMGLVLQSALSSKPSRCLPATEIAPGHYIADAKLSQSLLRRSVEPAPTPASSHRRYGSLNYPSTSRTANQLATVLNPDRPLVGTNVRRQSVTNSLGDGTEVGVATMSFCSESPSDLAHVDFIKRPRPNRVHPSNPKTGDDYVYPDSLNPAGRPTPSIHDPATNASEVRGDEFLDSLEPSRFSRSWSIDR